MEPVNVSQDLIHDESQDLTQDESQDLTQDESQDLTQDESLDTTKIKLSKMDIEKLIAQNSERVSFNVVNDAKHKSDVWKRFCRIIVDRKLQDFVSCNTCQSIYAYMSRSGTKSLNRHVCQSPTTNRKRGTATPLTQTSKSMQHYLVKKVPQHAKHSLNKNITFGLAKDLHSLRTVEGTGFKHYAQALIDFGATYGSHRVEDVIQHRTTLRNTYVPELCNDARQRYKLLFQLMPANHKYAFSKDLWSEKYQKRNFLSLSCHFIDDDWELHAVMLGLDEMVESKTVEYIRERCAEILKSYFDESLVERIIETSFAVTDGGSNMISVFKNRLPCECHKLNLFVSWTLNERKLPKEEKILKRAKKGKPFNPRVLFNLQTHCPRIFASLTGVKNTVTYFKQSYLNATLSSTLKQAVETRWDSELELLESYNKVKDEVQTVLLKHRQLEKIQDIDHELLDDLIKFLQPIRKCSQTLSGDKYPTLQLVAVSFYELYEIIHNFEPKSKSEDMQRLLRQAKICFKEFGVTEDIHYAACILDPRYRQLNFAKKNDRRNAVDYLKTMVRELEEQFEDDLQLQQRDTPSTSQAPTNTKPSRFERFQDIESDDESNELPEVDRYMNQKFDLIKYKDKKGNLQILQFWRDMKNYPAMSKIARTLLAVPAAETTDERNFSDAGLILTPKRTLLSGQSLSELLYIHTSVKAPM